MATNASDKRLKRVPVTSELIDPLLRGGVAIVRGIPDDAKVVRTYRNEAKDMFYFVVHSSGFEPVGEGEEIPEHSMSGVYVDKLEEDFNSF